MSSPYNTGPVASLPLLRGEPLGDRLPVHNWEVADVAALSSITVTAADIGKIAKVASPLSFYILLNNTGNVWGKISQNAGAVNITVNATPPSAPEINDLWFQIP